MKRNLHLIKYGYVTMIYIYVNQTTLFIDLHLWSLQTINLVEHQHNHHHNNNLNLLNFLITCLLGHAPANDFVASRTF